MSVYNFRHKLKTRPKKDKGEKKKDKKDKKNKDPSKGNKEYYYDSNSSYRSGKKIFQNSAIV